MRHKGWELLLGFFQGSSSPPRNDYFASCLQELLSKAQADARAPSCESKSRQLRREASLT